MSKIVETDRVQLYINGQIINYASSEVEFVQDRSNYGLLELVSYECNICGNGWNFSSADYCLECESKDIKEIKTLI